MYKAWTGIKELTNKEDLSSCDYSWKQPGERHRLCIWNVFVELVELWRAGLAVDHPCWERPGIPKVRLCGCFCTMCGLAPWAVGVLYFCFLSPLLDCLSSLEYLQPKAFTKTSSDIMLSNVYDLTVSSLCHQMETRTFYGGEGEKDRKLFKGEIHLSYRKTVWCEEKKSSICCVPFSWRQMMAYQKEHHQRRCVNGESLVLLCAPYSWSRPSGKPVAVCFCSCCIIYDNKLAKKVFFTGFPDVTFSKSSLEPLMQETLVAKPFCDIHTNNSMEAGRKADGRATIAPHE